MLVFTWNVGHKAPKSSELETWLPPRGEGLDVLVVATQENSYLVHERDSADVISPVPLAGAHASATGPEQVDLDHEHSDPDEEHEPEPHAAVQAPKPPPRRFRKGALMRTRYVPDKSVGKADWTTGLFCGKNLCGTREIKVCALAEAGGRAAHTCAPLGAIFRVMPSATPPRGPTRSASLGPHPHPPSRHHPPPPLRSTGSDACSITSTWVLRRPPSRGGASASMQSSPRCG